MSIKQEVEKETTQLKLKCNSYLRADNFVLYACNIALNTDTTILKGNDVDDENLLGLHKYYKDLSKDLETNDRTVAKHFKATLFVELIASVEIYFSNVIKIIISAHPKKMGKTQFTLSEVMDKSVDELIENASEQFVYKIMYKKANEILKDLCSVLSIDQETIIPYWNGFIEAKARRDIGVHNNWICNETYLRKVKEVGIIPHVSVGDILAPDETGYSISIIDNLRALVDSINSEVQSVYS